MQGPSGPPGGKIHQRSGQCLPQGRFAVPGAVAAAVQRVAAGVQRHAHLVLVDGNMDVITLFTFIQPVHFIVLLQPLGHRLLTDGLYIAHAHQLASPALACHREAAAPRDVILPGDRADQLEQLLKAAGLALAHDQLHPVGCAQLQVGAESGIRPAQKAHAALIHRGFKAQCLQFPFYQAFQPKGCRGDPFHHLFILRWVHYIGMRVRSTSGGNGGIRNGMLMLNQSV